MGERLKEDMVVRIRVARPAMFNVAINNRDRGGLAGLGLELGTLAESISLAIVGVGREGAVAEYNETAPEALQIRESDLIASVDGRRGRGGELRQHLDVSRKIELGLMRAPI